MEKFQFDPEAAASRAELVGHLKIDKESEDSKRLLIEWASVGEKLVETGAMDLFKWNWEEAQVYLEAEQKEAAVYVLKGALFEAIQQGRDAETDLFSTYLQQLGEDPDDLSDFGM